jgi:alpha-glucosidase
MSKLGGKIRLIGIILFATQLANARAQNPSPVVIRSPDGRNEIQFHVSSAEPSVQYLVQRNGKLLVEPSALDLRLAKLGALANGSAIESVAERSIDELSTVPWGKASQIHDHCNVVTVKLKSGSGIEWHVELRAFNDGVALRYGLPQQEKLSEFTIEGEFTEFRLAKNSQLLFLPLPSFTSSHEGLYQRSALSELPRNQLCGVPLLAVWPDGTAAAITEARLRDYAGMYLERDDEKDACLWSRLSPLPGQTACVTADTPHWSPWRVLLLGDHAGKLIESTLLECLNEPADGDFSWVEPGKTTFPWWNGTIEHGPPSTPEGNFAVNKRYIDFCAKHGITYHSISSVSGNLPWFVQREPGFGQTHEDTDILTPRPDIDLPRILNYAKSRGVGIRLWVHWKPVSEHLEEAFALYEQWGVRGLMVDFMDRDDQEMVELQERILQVAAKHKLHIQFHGAYKPTGEHRTYPNMVNREGVLNLEYLKWSDKCDPAHSVNVAYTRLLAGPIDYHLGGFRAVRREQFQPRQEMPVMLGSRCYLLAMYVVYENPMPMVCDDPVAYEGAPGFDFVVEVPTTWDETRFVAGTVGEYVAVARRKGDTWYLGGITDWTSRTVNLPLEFLGEGEYMAKLYLDASLNGEEPNEIRQEKRTLSADDVLSVELASGGGVAAVFRPKE